VIEKDPRQLVQGLPALKSLFKLPHKINLLLWVVTALITRSSSDLPRLLERLCDGFGTDPKLVNGLLNVSKRDYSQLAAFAQRFGSCETETMDHLITLLGHLNLLSVNKASNPQQTLLSKKAAAGGGDGDSGGGGGGDGDDSGLAYKELFQLADTNKSSSLTFDQFVDLLKYLSLPLSPNVALRIFSEVQRGDGTLGPDEFERGIHLLEDRIGDRVLDSVGCSTSQLLGQFLMRLGLLLLLFIFIFMGINAFTNGGTFQSVVNSAIAMSAGLGVGGGSQDSSSFQLTDLISDVLDRLKAAL